MFQQMLQAMNQMKMSMEKITNQNDPKGKFALLAQPQPDPKKSDVPVTYETSTSSMKQYHK